MTREAHEMLWEIKTRLAAIEHRIGLVCRSDPLPSDSRVPRIPLEPWVIRPDLDTVSDIMCGTDKLATVFHCKTTPQLATMIAAVPELYLALRELVLLFQNPTKELGEVWASFHYNGHPVAPSMVREYLAACAILAKADPHNPLDVAEQPPPRLEDTTVGLGPVELQGDVPETCEAENRYYPSQAKGRPKDDRGIRLFQFPDGRYIVTSEKNPVDPETGELLVKVGRIEIEYGHGARGAPDEDERHYFR